jgi:hypothetical protein
MKPCPRRFLVRSGLGILAVLMALLVGCGSKEKERKAVSGTVKVKGVPLTSGMIQFLPTAESTATTQATAGILEGKYELPASQGLEPGKYQVRITARGAPKGQKGRRPPETTRTGKRKQSSQGINAETPLECEVTPDGSNTFDFDLK